MLGIADNCSKVTPVFLEGFGCEPGFGTAFAPVAVLSIIGALFAPLGVCLLVAWLVARFAWRKPTAP